LEIKCFVERSASIHKKEGMDDIEDDVFIEIPQINVTEIFKCTEIIKKYSIPGGDINLLNLVSEVNNIVLKKIFKSKHNQKQTCIMDFFNKL